MICKQLCDISSDKEHFDKAVPVNNEVLKNSGFNGTLSFCQQYLQDVIKVETLFSLPPFSSNIKTNVELFNSFTEAFPGASQVLQGIK